MSGINRRSFDRGIQQIYNFGGSGAANAESIVEKIQYATGNLTAGNASVSASVSSFQKENTLALLNGYYTTTTNPNATDLLCAMDVDDAAGSATSFNFVRQGTSNQVNAAGVLLEFVDGVLNQVVRDTFTLSGASSNDALPSFTADYGCFAWLGETCDVANANYHYGMTTLDVVSGPNLNASRHTGTGSADSYYQFWEFDSTLGIICRKALPDWSTGAGDDTRMKFGSLKQIDGGSVSDDELGGVPLFMLPGFAALNSSPSSSGNADEHLRAPIEMFDGGSPIKAGNLRGVASGQASNMQIPMMIIPSRYIRQSYILRVPITSTSVSVALAVADSNKLLARLVGFTSKTNVSFYNSYPGAKFPARVNWDGSNVTVAVGTVTSNDLTAFIQITEFN